MSWTGPGKRMVLVTGFLVFLGSAPGSVRTAEGQAPSAPQYAKGRAAPADSGVAYDYEGPEQLVEGLRALHPQRARGKPSPEEWFQQGLFFLEEGKPKEAVVCFEQSLKEPVPWEEYAYYYLLKATWNAGLVEQALGLCKTFQHHFPEGLLLGRVNAIEADGYQKRAAYTLACRAYASLLERGDRVDLRLKYANALESANQLRDAYESYEKILQRWPWSAEARVARKKAGQIAEGDPLLKQRRETVKWKFRNADQCLRGRAYSEALASYRELLGGPLTGFQRRNALKGQTLALLRKGEIDAAHRDLRAMMGSFPDADETVECALAVGREYWRKDKNRVAFPILKLLLDRHPKSKEAMRASYILGRIHFEEGRLTGAIRQFKETRLRFPGTEWEDEAAWWEAWCYYLKGNYGACAKHLRQCISDRVWDVSIPRALYWEARCLGKAGDSAGSEKRYRELQKMYPGDYYGFLAERRLAGDGLFPEDFKHGECRIQRGAAVLGDGVLEKLGDSALVFLVAVELRREAVERLDWLRRQGRGKALKAQEWVQAYASTGDHGRAIRMALQKRSLDKVLQKGEGALTEVDRRFLRTLYPLPFWDEINQGAERLQLDPYFVAGLIRQESLFVSDAVSPAGAIGLMQILPATGSSVARQMGFEGFRVSSLPRPEVNIRIGTTYLADLAAKYEQDWTKVLACYNAGPRAVARWVGAMPSAEIDEFVEGITYRETRNYLRKVLYNWSLYRKIYCSSTM